MKFPQVLLFAFYFCWMLNAKDSTRRSFLQMWPLMHQFCTVWNIHGCFLSACLLMPAPKLSKFHCRSIGNRWSDWQLRKLCGIGPPWSGQRYYMQGPASLKDYCNALMWQTLDNRKNTALAHHQEFWGSRRFPKISHPLYSSGRGLHQA